MSLRYTLLVLSPPTSLINQRAREFALGLISAGHQIERVFFHDDGANTGLGTTVYPQDETNPVEEWASFGRDNGVELIVCVASALKRGVLNQSEAQRYRQITPTLHPDFEIGGLGLLVDAGSRCDRLITFGG